MSDIVESYRDSAVIPICFYKHVLEGLHRLALEVVIAIHTILQRFDRVIKVELCIQWIVYRVWEDSSSPMVDGISRFPDPWTSTSAVVVSFCCGERRESKSRIILSNSLSKFLCL